MTRGEAPREATRAPAVFAVAVNASGVVVAAVERAAEPEAALPLPLLVASHVVALVVGMAIALACC